LERPLKEALAFKGRNSKVRSLVGDKMFIQSQLDLSMPMLCFIFFRQQNRPLQHNSHIA